MKINVLLVSTGIFHPSMRARAALWSALRGVEEADFRQAATLEALPRVLDAGFVPHAVVLFIHQQKISERALGALERYVDGGGGVLAVHSATASFKQQPRYFHVLGGRFTGHGPVETFTASPVTGATGPFDGLGAFTVRDELYLHELLPGVTAHYTAHCGGVETPVVWSYQRGGGSVCYACPGHLSASLREPVVVEILRRGLRWAAGIVPGEGI